MKNKLIEIISDVEVQLQFKLALGRSLSPVENATILADHLIERGVILPPCKVGDDIYWINPETNEIELAKSDIKAVCYYGNEEFKIIVKAESSPEDIGTEWAMLTREEAEQALERRSKG